LDPDCRKLGIDHCGTDGVCDPDCSSDPDCSNLPQRVPVSVLAPAPATPPAASPSTEPPPACQARVAGQEVPVLGLGWLLMLVWCVWRRRPMSA
ncbi:MAG: hypothetical protein ACPGUV_10315, partial [Polyangiales bacterium]